MRSYHKDRAACSLNANARQTPGCAVALPCKPGACSGAAALVRHASRPQHHPFPSQGHAPSVGGLPARPPRRAGWGADNPDSIGEGCTISPRASVADHDVTIGKNVVIEDYAVIYPNTVIGDGCTIRSGAKLGIQDYNYYTEAAGPVHLVHAGGLVLEPNVEVGYNTVIGKSLYADDVTIVGRNTKIAHNCSIGHDVQLQEQCMVYSGTVIGGYTVVGKGSHLTMNATLRHLAKRLQAHHIAWYIIHIVSGLQGLFDPVSSGALAPFLRRGVVA